MLDILHVESCPFTGHAQQIDVENRAKLHPEDAIQLRFGIAGRIKRLHDLLASRVVDLGVEEDRRGRLPHRATTFKLFSRRFHRAT